MAEVTVVGGGLSGSEAAWQLAERGHDVTLHEMRPLRGTAAHKTDLLGEIVCSNTFKSEDPSNAHGLLKLEMDALGVGGSLLLACARESRIPGGTALTVDRGEFAQRMTAAIEAHPRITVVREEMAALPEGPAIIATGPLTSDALSGAIRGALGDEGLAFFDAIAPVVSFESLDMDTLFRASRWGKGGEAEGDYLNAPMTKEQYEAFIEALKTGEEHAGHDWENVPYFEGCLPIEVMAHRGAETLRFGPMKPVGLPVPQFDGKWAHAVVQLRREDRAGNLWNLVGFQTRLRIPEQKRIFRMIPGLQDAEFLRWGSIHRNTYLNFPARLSNHGSLRERPELIFAGQITGVEGYTESTATGILAAMNLDRIVRGEEPVVPPPTTMLGGLLRYLRESEPKHFAPMNSNFGLLDPLDRRVKDKDEKRAILSQRAQADFAAWMETHGIRGGVEAVAAR
ncbi:methylenetetrahydrofolate--tRNA-(uracil(54)-C(5))-methyltransferase (FADH(2)-oxidizing) TrmFO [Longimicrobium sp.]|uniref:methylenetetrahydrofolate--tRNA-(uracil(54)- C(5))-methyltransferase (FADH(2)-oxidizing) TrmFO n=1 Tax=Longimicrobium sp. TaxID=2029185 RepID=UPI002E381262|nr:methylenetetrahydrofolate--tRNA-(uracil(54)-C(5))-methyltransferase (FADH(2)-oxidizing) TrmFO [Longimicrobium sp.]HEX6037494.1 methylenetetrahydrofolate--tRNA-(uracil(54)-C(5))-methyltransferase (FADH(2)-oxidizing) TrmFO [Longimicrobium sp.]